MKAGSIARASDGVHGGPRDSPPGRMLRHDAGGPPSRWTLAAPPHTLRAFMSVRRFLSREWRLILLLAGVAALQVWLVHDMRYLASGLFGGFATGGTARGNGALWRKPPGRSIVPSSDIRIASARTV